MNAHSVLEETRARDLGINWSSPLKFKICCHYLHDEKYLVPFYSDILK
jgi:hypothetical protein